MVSQLQSSSGHFLKNTDLLYSNMVCDLLLYLYHMVNDNQLIGHGESLIFRSICVHLNKQVSISWINVDNQEVRQRYFLGREAMTSHMLKIFTLYKTNKQYTNN